MKLGIYIFCRDLRLSDNLGLANFAEFMQQKSAGDFFKLLPVFILNPQQVTLNKKNKYYFSNSAVQFMCESLVDLNKQLGGGLKIFYGDPSKICSYLLKKFKNVSGLGFQTDFSEFARRRQDAISKLCKKHEVHLFVEENDLTLVSVGDLRKKNGAGFKQFGAFYKFMQKNKELKKIKLVSVSSDIFYKKFHALKYLWDTSKLRKLYKENDNLAQRGGRKNALKKLASVTKKRFGDYAEKRNFLSHSTSGISGYLNFGCISIREAYKKISESLGTNSELLKQIFWRDFYLQAVIFLPNGNKYSYLDERYKNIKWKNDRKDWEKIMQGRTGFLLVDAGMRQMIETGFMHNRARMIVGVFWTKYCLIDSFHPKYGSQVGYSKLLLDAVGISQNKMNHHWLTEFDYPGKKYAPKGVPLAGRPMDVSNKNIRKFDPDGDYIRKWIPEFRNTDIKVLVNWDRGTYQKHKIHVPPMFEDPKQKYQDWIKACKVK